MNTLDKKTLRQTIIAARQQVTPDERHQFTHSSLQQLRQNKAFHQAKTVMAYMDFRHEAPTSHLIKELLDQGKRLILPFTDASFHIIAYEIPVSSFEVFEKRSPFLLTSPLGIWEPNPIECKKIEPTMIDLVLVPGVAFDQYGHRLGYGKGCYDEFLPQLRPDALTLGVAYPQQIVPHIPTAPFDVSVDGLLPEPENL